LPLGILEEAEYESVEVKLAPGDAVVLYTDGINECMDAEGNQLTTQRLVEEIRISQAKSPEAIGKVVCNTVTRHAGAQPPIDDMCLVCLGRNE
jgi:serine phosphatase RsbU (regulator of sigma subunit)